jgi:hypothetical protein
MNCPGKERRVRAVLEVMSDGAWKEEDSRNLISLGNLPRWLAISILSCARKIFQREVANGLMVAFDEYKKDKGGANHGPKR